jgi:hypothetical protein
MWPHRPFSFSLRNKAMIRRRSALTAIVLAWVGTCACGQELTTDAERDWKAVRSSNDPRTKLMADRWYNSIKQQEWSDASGKFKTSAKYVEHDPNLAWVKLRMIRGTGKDRVVKDVQIPLDKLSKACQARVRTISVLAEKIAEAKEDEAKKDSEEEENADAAGGRGGESLDQEAMPGEGRGGRSEFDRGGLAGMDPREVVAQREPPPQGRGRGAPAEEAPVVTNNGPPLPAALPPLPSRSSANAAPEASPSLVPPAMESAPGTAAGPMEFQHPATAEELKAAFEKAFAAGDKETLDRLVYWGELSPELRQLTQSRLLDYAGTAQLHRCQLGVAEGGESADVYTVESTTHLLLEFETRADYFELAWPVGEVGGNYYLGALSGAATPSARR